MTQIVIDTNRHEYMTQIVIDTWLGKIIDA